MLRCYSTLLDLSMTCYFLSCPINRRLGINANPWHSPQNRVSLSYEVHLHLTFCSTYEGNYYTYYAIWLIVVNLFYLLIKSIGSKNIGLINNEYAFYKIVGAKSE